MLSQLNEEGQDQPVAFISRRLIPREKRWSAILILKSLKKFFPLLPQSAKETATRALILSRVDYANGLYVGLPDYMLKKLQVVQNAAARLVFSVPIMKSVGLHLRMLHWLPVMKRVQYKALVIAHRTLYSGGPVYLRKRFSFYMPTRHLRSASQLLAPIPRVRLQRMGGRSLAFRVATAWNVLPLSLRSTQNLGHIKKQLKAFLF